MKNKVLYLCFYGTEEVRNNRICFPSAEPKIDYIAKTLNQIGCDVTILSCVMAKPGYVVKRSHQSIGGDISEIIFLYSNNKNSFIGKIDRFLFKLRIKNYLLKNINNYSKIIIYHSIFYLDILNKIRKKFPNKFIIEIEDVYSELNQNQKISQKKEWNYLQKFDFTLCVNDLISKKINSKYSIVSYGAYSVTNYGKTIFNNKPNEIKLVYAGVIETIRKAAFLAIQALEFLPSNYVLNICGFGNKEDISKLEDEISTLNKKLNRVAAKFLGMKTKTELSKILYDSDIALSTHSYSNNDINSANCTFPSKIISYMAHGLPVVCQKLDVLCESTISNLLFFYPSPDPKMVADTILSINSIDKDLFRNKIIELDYSFKVNLLGFLKERT